MAAAESGVEGVEEAPACTERNGETASGATVSLKTKCLTLKAKCEQMDQVYLKVLGKYCVTNCFLFLCSQMTYCTQNRGRYTR